MKRSVLCSLAAVMMFGLAGCGGGDGSSAEVTTFEATVVGDGGESGKLSVTIEAKIPRGVSLAAGSEVKDTATAYGTYTLVGGGTFSLTGEFHFPTNAVALSGRGYAFTAGIKGEEMSCTYTGPDVGGACVGYDSTTHIVKRYNGTHSAGAGKKGIFNMTISIDGSTGTIYGLGDNRTEIRGTLNGNNISARAGSVAITGIMNGDFVSGTFVNPTNPKDHGTWEGSSF